MAQLVGIPQNLISKAMKMVADGASIEHVAQWARCPTETIQSLWDARNKPAQPAPELEVEAPAPKAKAKAKAKKAPEEPTEENTAPDQ